MIDLWFYAVYRPDRVAFYTTEDLSTVHDLPEGSRVVLIVDLEDDSLYGSMEIPVVDGRPQRQTTRFDDRGQYYLW